MGLKHLKVNSKEAHQSTIIFLHGLGDSGHGWLPITKMMWSAFPNTKWILPHAPEIPVTLNGGMAMPAWFDLGQLTNLTDSKFDDEKGLLASVAGIDQLIQAEVDAGIPENKIILGGFSQGGAVTALSALMTKRDLAGYVVLSSWVTLGHKIESMVTSKAKESPMFWGHGRDDNVVQYKFGTESIKLLQKIGYPMVPATSAFGRPGLKFNSYSGLAHSSSLEEIEDLKKWLAEALK